MLVLVTHSCLSLFNPMDCSPPGSSVYGILQAQILEWVAITSPGESSRPRDWTQVSHIAGRLFYHPTHQGCYFSSQTNPLAFLPEACCWTGKRKAQRRNRKTQALGSQKSSRSSLWSRSSLLQRHLGKYSPSLLSVLLSNLGRRMMTDQPEWNSN